MIRRPVALALAAAVFAVPADGFAACERQGALICGSGAPRVASEAELTVSRGGSFLPLDTATGLRAGDRVLTGASAARVALGPSCTTTVGPGALVSFTRSGDRTCLSTAGGPGDGIASTGAIGPDGREIDRPFGVPPVAVGAAVAAGAAIGLGIALGGGGGSDRTLPPTVSAQ